MAGVSNSNVSPVYLLAKNLPVNERVDNYSLCLVSAKTAGRASIIGAQKIGALWIIFPSTAASRLALLTKGISVAGKNLQLESQNPFIVRGSSGEEIPGTRLTISDVPISFSNETIEKALIKKGFKLRSKIKMEQIRDRDGKNTDWLSGRRFVWIDLPKSAIEATMPIGPFKAKLYHREMKGEMQCRNCLGKGHIASQCSREVVCMRCRKTGHRAADCFVTDRGDELGVENESEFPSLPAVGSADSDSEGSKTETEDSVWNTVHSRRRRRRKNRVLDEKNHQIIPRSELFPTTPQKETVPEQSAVPKQSQENLEAVDPLSTTFTIGDMEATSAVEDTQGPQHSNSEPVAIVENSMSDLSTTPTQPSPLAVSMENHPELNSSTSEAGHQLQSNTPYQGTGNELDDCGNGNRKGEQSKRQDKSFKELFRGTIPQYFRRQQVSNKRLCPDTSTSSEGTPTAASASTTV